MKGDTFVTSRFGLFQSILPVHRKQTLKDALAGFQLAAMNTPQALGYTKIAGTPLTRSTVSIPGVTSCPSCT